MFHAYEATEKALKGFLVRRGQTFPPAAGLVPVLAACGALSAPFGAFRGAAQTLNPYATRFRYPAPDPTAPPVPSLPEARLAVSLARRIVGFTQRRL